MASQNFSSYGLREANLAPQLTDDVTDTTYGAIERAYGAQEFTVNTVVTETELRGDDKVIEVDSNVANVDWTLNNALISFSNLKIMLGGTLTDIMDTVDPTEKVGEVYTIMGGQNLPYFALIGKTVKDGGSLKVVVPKAKATGGVEFSFVDEDYCVVTASGKGVARASDNKMIKFIKEDTEKPVVAADLD